MPSSKRARVVPTSKVRKNRKDLIRRLHTSVQEAAQQYNYIYVFDVENMRNNFIKQARTELVDSRIFMGKTKVMGVALGRNSETEAVAGSSALSPYLKGEVGLLFTDKTSDEIESFFETYVTQDFARSGAVASHEFRIPPGELHTAYGHGGEEEPLPIQIEPQLRKLGIPSRIVKGKVMLEESTADAIGDDEGYLVCREGDTLDSRQTNILKIFGVKMAEFKMGLRAMYDKQSGSVKEMGEMDVDAAV